MKQAMGKLKKYLCKRKMEETPEPKGKIFSRKKGNLQFVIQKHAARRLHYDLRLEVGGVLKSWAVPKGPSTDPQVKRLAVMVEDHPYEYRHFEGIIPSGYGKGTVMIWDHGTYDVDGKSGPETEKVIQEGLKKGAIHFTLNGDKLHGRFTLFKLKGEGDEWILIKSKDQFSSTQDITEKNRSAVSERTLEEIAGKAKIPPPKKEKKKKKPPEFVQPMLATLVDEPFDQKDWLFEIKWDGFRAIAVLDQQKVNIYSRNQLLFNDRFPKIVKALESLKLDAIFDGEIVALDKKGISHFQMLQNISSEQNIYYYVFDILFLNGEDLRDLPLIERKLLLKGLLAKQNGIRYSEYVEEQGKKFFKVCQKQGLEGIIGKKKTSLYESGQRSRAWVKIKAELRQEVVICGFTEPRKSRKHLGALIIGIYKKGILQFAGHVGGGFTEKKLEEVKDLLTPLVTTKCPFNNVPKTNTGVTWVKPQLLCEVKFKEWTTEGMMRMPIFLGIRADKPPQVIGQEKPKRVKTIVKQEDYNFITHKEKLFWEKEKISKGDLLGYYELIAPYILPYLIDRPESLRRYPNGFDKPGFFQKNITTYPEWLETIQITHTDKEINYMLIQDLRSLLFAVNLGCIEIHPWFSRVQTLEKPDFLMFDLDPVDIEFDAVVETAQAIHTLLTKIKVPSYCKTSGGRGLHIGVPLKAQYTYEQAKQFALLIATIIHNQLPNIVSLERSPPKRRKKVYIDCFQNNFGQTLASPYSVRAKPGAPVSTPLTWDEVKKGLNPSDYNLFNTLQRLKKKGDLIKPLLQKGANLQKALKLLQKFTL